MMAQEHTFALAVENLLSITITYKTSLIRVIYLELTRILNHLLAITTHALDVGAITPFLWGFEWREKILGFYEEASGARMHANFIRAGTVNQDITFKTIINILFFILLFDKKLKKLHNLLTYNSIWYNRLHNVGMITAKNACKFGFSGVMLRSTGIFWDLRQHIPYECYSDFNFEIPLGKKGDCYDRYLLRMAEMTESCKIILQAIKKYTNLKLFDYSVKDGDYKVILPPKLKIKTSMEELIHHFKLCTEGFSPIKKNVYMTTETPKGEFGVYLISDNTNMPYRCSIKAPGFLHLQNLNFLVKDKPLADLVTILGTLDIVFGEIDR